MSQRLRKEVLNLVSSLPDAHPARIAYENGSTPATLLRLLRDDPGAYDSLIAAIRDWNNRVIRRANDPAP
jgi:hypothetical protein